MAFGTAKPAGKPVAKKLTTPAPAAKAKAPSNRQEFTVKLEAPGMVNVEGVVQSISGDVKAGGILFLSHKKRGSSKQVVTPIPLKRVRFVHGDLKKGASVRVSYVAENHTFALLRRCELLDIDSSTGLLRGVDEKGSPFLIHEDNLNAVTTSDVPAPAIKVGAKGG